MQTFRCPPDLRDLIDREVDRLQGERPGATISRADAIREILYAALSKTKR